MSEEGHVSTVLKLVINFTTDPPLCKGLICTFAALALAACGPTLPDSEGTGSVADLRPGAPDTGADTFDPPPGEVDIATWNVRRYFDTRCDTGRCQRDDYEYLPSPEEFSARGEAIAEAITDLDVDIVLLQEVESQDCIDEISRHLGEEFTIAQIGEIGSPASVDVAVVARGELGDVRRHRHHAIERPDGSITSFAREFLEVELRVNHRTVIVFSAHFKSKSGDDAGRREGEAIAARRIALASAEANPGALVVVGGDLNDTPGSRPMDALLDAGDLTRVAEELGEDDWTYQWNETHSALDHLLLVVGSGGYVEGSAQVLRDGRGWRASDHAALRATFE